MKTAQVKFLGPPQNQQRVAQAGLVGVGRLEIDTDGVRLIGKKGKKLVPGLVGGLVGFVCMVGMIIFLIQFKLDRGRSGMKMVAMISLVAGVVPGAWLYSLLLAKLPGVPIDTRIPWSALTVGRATRQRIDLSAAALGGAFAIKALDPQSEAVLAEAFNVAQTLPS